VFCHLWAVNLVIQFYAPSLKLSPFNGNNECRNFLQKYKDLFYLNLLEVRILFPSILDRERNFSRFQKVKRPATVHNQPHIQWVLEVPSRG